jgi:hypothetical protein
MDLILIYFFYYLKHESDKILFYKIVGISLDELKTSKVTGNRKNALVKQPFRVISVSGRFPKKMQM